MYLVGPGFHPAAGFPSGAPAVGRHVFRVWVGYESGTVNKYCVRLSRSFCENLYAGIMLPGVSLGGSRKCSSTQLWLRRLERPFNGGPTSCPPPFTLWQSPQPFD